MWAARSLVERLENGHLHVGVDLLECFSRHLLVQRLEHGLLFRRRQVLDDVRDVRGVHLRQPFVGDLQLHAPGRIGLDEVDVLPGDDAWRNLLEQGAQREGGNEPLHQPPHRAAGPDVDREHVELDVAVGRVRVELDVVDPHDLAPVDVDDLLVEQVALEQQHAVEAEERQPRAGVGRRAHCRPERLHGLGRQHPITFRRADDEKRDPCRVFLGRHGSFAHTAAHRPARIADRGAEHF